MVIKIPMLPGQRRSWIEIAGSSFVHVGPLRSLTFSVPPLHAPLHHRSPTDTDSAIQFLLIHSNVIQLTATKKNFCLFLWNRKTGHLRRHWYSVCWDEQDGEGLSASGFQQRLLTLWFSPAAAGRKDVTTTCYTLEKHSLWRISHVYTLRTYFFFFSFSRVFHSWFFLFCFVVFKSSTCVTLWSKQAKKYCDGSFSSPVCGPFIIQFDWQFSKGQWLCFEWPIHNFTGDLVHC